MQDTVVWPRIRLRVHTDLSVITAETCFIEDEIGEEITKTQRLKGSIFGLGKIATILDHRENLVDDLLGSTTDIKEPISDITLRPIEHVGFSFASLSELGFG